MGQARHVLSDVDRVSMTANCAACGPVRLARKGKPNRVGCWNAHQASKAPRRSATERRRDLHFDRLSEEQGGRCAVCGTEEDLVVDHDHGTGAVRGLLCRSCNAGLGMFKDDPARLAGAIRYLERLREGP